MLEIGHGDLVIGPEKGNWLSCVPCTLWLGRNGDTGTLGYIIISHR